MAQKPQQGALFEEGAELPVQIGALLQRVEAQQDGLRDARRALEVLARPETLSREKAARRQLERLSEVALADGLGGSLGALIASVEAHLERQRRSARMVVMGALKRGAVEAGVEMVRLGDSPPTVLLAPLTIELDFDVDKARMSYARQVVSETACDAEVILEARQSAIELIRSSAVPSEEFFELLRQAYRVVLFVQGRAEGERVDLVDLLVPLAAMRAGVGAWRGVSKIDAMPRYMMAYQLQRLRREGKLESGGVRVDLGTATGGSTRNKRDVLFVPTSPTEGQYYLTLRMEARS